MSLYRETALDLPLYRAAGKGDLKTITVLRSKGANVNYVADPSDTPLMFAVANGKYEAAELLLKMGAQVNFRNGRGQSVLSQSGSKRMSELLKRYGAQE